MPCACIDTQKVHINYIKFQSLLRRFLHIKYVNSKIISHVKRVVDAGSVALGKDYSPLISIHRIHHEERNQDVCTLMGDIEKEYLNLYDLGKNSRYYSLGDMPTTDEVTTAVQLDLPKIEDYVKSHL